MFFIGWSATADLLGKSAAEEVKNPGAGRGDRVGGLSDGRSHSGDHSKRVCELHHHYYCAQNKYHHGLNQNSGAWPGRTQGIRCTSRAAWRPEFHVLFVGEKREWDLETETHSEENSVFLSFNSIENCYRLHSFIIIQQVIIMISPWGPRLQFLILSRTKS